MNHQGITPKSGPGKGYRQVHPGETLRKGDQFLDGSTDRRKWVATACFDMVATDIRYYRRKLLVQPDLPITVGNAPWNTDDKFKSERAR